MPPSPEDRALSFVDTPVYSLLNAVVWVTAAVTAAVAWVSWGLTFTPWTGFMSANYNVPFSVLAFPLLGWTVATLVRRQRQSGGARWSQDLLKELPSRMRIPLAVAVALVATGFFVAQGALRGQPEYDPAGHRDVLNDHGHLIPVSHAAFLQAVAAQNRIFLGGAALFTSFAAAVSYGDWARRRRALTVSEQGPRPVRPRPRLPLAAAALALIAIAALAGTAGGATLIITRFDADGAHFGYLHPGRQVPFVLAAGDYTVFAGCPQDMDCAMLLPDDVLVRTTAGKVPVVPDPSDDHNSVGAKSFLGRLSFRLPAAGTTRIELARDVRQPVFVAASEGQELRAFAGWGVLTGLSLLILLAAGRRLLLSYALPALRRPPGLGSGSVRA